MINSYMVMLDESGNIEGFREGMGGSEIYNWLISKAEYLRREILKLFPDVEMGEATVFGVGCGVPEEREKEFLEKVSALPNVGVVMRDFDFPAF